MCPLAGCPPGAVRGIGARHDRHCSWRANVDYMIDTTKVTSTPWPSYVCRSVSSYRRPFPGLGRARRRAQPWARSTVYVRWNGPLSRICWLMRWPVRLPPGNQYSKAPGRWLPSSRPIPGYGRPVATVSRNDVATGAPSHALGWTRSLRRSAWRRASDARRLHRSPCLPGCSSAPRGHTHRCGACAHGDTARRQLSIKQLRVEDMIGVLQFRGGLFHGGRHHRSLSSFVRCHRR